MQNQNKRLDNSAQPQISLHQEASPTTTFITHSHATPAGAISLTYVPEESHRISDTDRIYFSDKNGQTQQIADTGLPPFQYKYSVSLRPPKPVPVAEN
jgi:hypothetical protein